MFTDRTYIYNRKRNNHIYNSDKTYTLTRQRVHRLTISHGSVCNMYTLFHCACMSVRVCVYVQFALSNKTVFVCACTRSLLSCQFFYAGEMLICSHKRVVHHRAQCELEVEKPGTITMSST